LGFVTSNCCHSHCLIKTRKCFRVISGDFVTIDDGTGIVHTAPTLVDDAKVAKEATPEVPPLLVLDESALQFH
jgi:isoleucyl-tRNA synthetase